jgi:hypothetical protein
MEEKMKIEGTREGGTYKRQLLAIEFAVQLGVGGSHNIVRFVFEYSVKYRHEERDVCKQTLDIEAIKA